MLRILLAALFVVSCAARQPPTKATDPLSETQRRATVAVHVICDTGESIRQWRGSGVIVSESLVLTAYHVADCGGESLIAVETLSGILVMATLGNFDPDSDVASLVLLEPIPGHGVTLAPPPPVGHVVCSEAAIPTRARKCGKVIWLAAKPAQNDIRNGMHVEGGNSGSGVYDQLGRLVGIVTLRRTDRPGGAAASVWPHRVLLMPLSYQR